MKDPVDAKKYFEEVIEKGFGENLSYAQIYKSFKKNDLPYPDKQLRRMISLYPTAETVTKSRSLFFIIIFGLSALLLLDVSYLYTAARTAGITGGIDVVLLVLMGILTTYFIFSANISKYFSVAVLGIVAIVHPFLLFLNNDFRFNAIIIISLAAANVVGIVSKSYIKKAMPHFRLSQKHKIEF